MHNHPTLLRDIQLPNVSPGEAGLVAYTQAPPSAQAQADARYAVLKLWWAFQKDHPVRQGDQRQAFIASLEAGTPPLPEALRQGVSRRSLFNWEQAYRQHGIAGLLPHRTHVSRSSIPEEMQNYLIGMWAHYPHATYRQLHQALQTSPAFQGKPLPPYQAVCRFLTAWKGNDPSLVLRQTNPKQWRSKYRAAFGKADEDVTCLNHVWEMDSTKADIFLDDGQRHSIIGVIDVYSRRLRLLVSRTSKTQAVLTCLRGALLAWGVPEMLKTDNGKDYTAFQIDHVCDALEMHHHLCTPHAPWEKPFIERVLGTFSHDLLPLCPGYTGHDVASAQALREQETFAGRLMTEGEEVQLRMTAAALQDFCTQWCEAIYAQRPHQGLDGQTPEARARAWLGPVKRIQDQAVRALDILLAPLPSDKPTRKVDRKGIRIERRLYIAPELVPYIGRQVLPKLDEADLGRIYVFTIENAFICIAEDPEWTGVSRAEVATLAHQAQQQMMADGRKALKRAAKESAQEAVHAQILGYYQDRQDKILYLPRPETPYSTEALQAAAEAATFESANLPPLPRPLPPSRVDIQPIPAKDWQHLDGWQRFEYLLKLPERSSEQEAAMQRFVRSEYCQETYRIQDDYLAQRPRLAETLRHWLASQKWPDPKTTAFVATWIRRFTPATASAAVSTG